MYDIGKLLFVIVLVFGFVSLPFLLNLGKTTPLPEPDLNTPAINHMSQKQCILPGEVMRTKHMQLLDDWRNSVVRKGKRFYGEIDGKLYEKSLQNTCMHCHSNKEEFCDRCHSYVHARPYCWDCHIEPKENKS
jgi:hypothetical protein